LYAAGVARGLRAHRLLLTACHLPPQLRQLRQQGKHAAGIMHGEKLIGLRGHLKSTRCNNIHNYNPFGPVYAINS